VVRQDVHVAAVKILYHSWRLEMAAMAMAAILAIANLYDATNMMVLEP
jgi:hypothetical protein